MTSQSRVQLISGGFMQLFVFPGVLKVVINSRARQTLDSIPQM